MEQTGDAAVERAQVVTGIRLSRMEVGHRGAFGPRPLHGFSSEVNIEHIPTTGVRIVVKCLPFVHLCITQWGPSALIYRRIHVGSMCR